MEETCTERQNVGGVSFFGVETVLRLERDAWSMLW